MKKLLTFLASALLLFALVGCSDDGAPSGMKLASDRAKVDYSLYIPEEWNVDETDVVSRSHAENDISSVSVFTFECDEGAEIAEWWQNTYKPSIEPTLDKFELLENGEETLVDKKAGRVYIFTSEMTKTDGEETASIAYKHKMVIVKNNAKMYVIWYNGTVTERTDYYEQSLEAFDEILSQFRFTPLEASKELEAKNDKNAPEGMKLASDTKIVLYSLYVPESWIINEQSAMTMAYASEENKSSISVMQWNLTENSQTIDMWWENYHKKELMETMPSFTVLEEGTSTALDSKEAKSYVYTVTISGTTYKYFVTAAIDQGSIHVITYTSTEALYDEELTTVKEQILPNFKFN